MKFATILGLSALVLSTSAFAGEAYRCSLVEGEPEFTVEVNLETQKAAFFDNDAWYVVPQTDYRSIETYPSIDTYTFTGTEYGGKPLQIILELLNGFRVTPSGSVAYEGGPTPQKSDLDCDRVEAKDLWSGI